MLQPADYGMTEMALNTQPGDEQLFVKFYMAPVQNEQRSKEEGRPIFEDREFIEIRIPGQAHPAKQDLVRVDDRNRFPRHYAAFKARVEQNPVKTGTPLVEWPGINRGLVEELKFYNVTTIEELISMSDTNGQKFMGINAIKAKAKTYLETATGQAAANALLETKTQLEEQLAINASLEAANKSLLQRMEVLEDLVSKGSSEPKRRGRPPKGE